VEQQFDDVLAALKALARTEIDVLARVYPWDLPRLDGDARLTIGQYAVPSVHVLVPVGGEPLLQSKMFRRALVYALDREAILYRQILDNRQLEGCQLISGPFPMGASADDPLGYAYDPQIKPRPHDPELAWALLKASAAEAGVWAPDSGGESLVVSLTLAHPADELARGACESIRRYLAKIGVLVKLKELPPGQVVDETGQCDLLYGEWTLAEPVVDVWRLTAPDGPLADTSAHLRLPLRRLARAANWQEVREQLRQMHRVAHAEVSVVPLWQMADFFAVRTHVKGVGQRPAVLYENIENWQIEPWIPRD
jgi:ABC-type transport system substrate-binding protein